MSRHLVGVSFSFFLFTSFLYGFFGTFTPCIPCPPISQSPISAPHACSILSQNKIKKLKPKQNKSQNFLAPPSSLTLEHLFIHLSGTGSLGAPHSVPFCPASLTCICSLQWVIGPGSSPLASGTPSSLKLLSGSLTPPWVMEIPWLSFHRTSSFAGSIR